MVRPRPDLDDHVLPRRVVIVGGGFAGLFAARAFGNRPVAVTVLDKAPHHLFQPLLYQCATGVLSEGQIAVPLRTLFRRHPNVDVVMGEATDLDPAGRTLVALSPTGTRLELPYDHLVVAAGVQGSYFGHDELAEYAPQHEDPRRRADHPAARLRRVRVGPGHRRPRGAAPLAGLRPGRRRAHRCRAGRSDPRTRHDHPAPGVPPHRPGECAGDALRRRAPAPRRLRPETVGEGGHGTHHPRRRPAPGHHRHRCRRARPGRPGSRRHPHPAPRRDRAVDRRGLGARLRPAAGRSDRRRAGPLWLAI